MTPLDPRRRKAWLHVARALANLAKAARALAEEDAPVEVEGVPQVDQARANAIMQRKGLIRR